MHSNFNNTNFPLPAGEAAPASAHADPVNAGVKPAAAEAEDFEILHVPAGSQWNVAADPEDPEAGRQQAADAAVNDDDDEDDVVNKARDHLLHRLDDRPYRYTAIASGKFID